MRPNTSPFCPRNAWSRWLLLPALALILMLTACGGSSSSNDRDRARATVLVYMVASDLEENWALATSNFEEMMQVGSINGVNIIVESGGARKDGWRTVKRQKVNQGSLELITDLGSQNMIEPDNLQSFIEWGVATYPADSYHIVFWDHGGGPLGGFGVDTVHAPGKTMSMPQLAKALANAQGTTGVTFDLVGFDACLMANAEVAYMLSPYARYMVASQEVEPGAGWNWAAYLGHITGNSNSDAQSAGKAIVDGFVAKMEKAGQTHVTLSLTDLSKVSAVMESLDSMALTIADKLNTADLTQQHQAWADLAYVRSTSHDFQTSWLFGGMYDLVDLGDFIGKPQLSMLGVSEQQLKAAETALDEAVVYNRYGKNLWAASGLTLYMPLVSVKPGSPLDYTRHAALSIPDGLKTLVRRYAEIATSAGLPSPSLDPVQWDSTVYYAQLRNPSFSAIEYAILWDASNPANPRQLAIKPLDANPPLYNDQDVRIAANRDDWFLLPSAAGGSVPVSVLPDDIPRMEDSYAMYTIPVWARDTDEPGMEGSEGLLQVEYTKDLDGNKTYRVIGFLEEDGASPYASRPDPEGVVAGAELYPLFFHNGEWIPDLDRKIISFDAGNADTPPAEWWSLETATAVQACQPLACEIGFGVSDYRGTLITNMSHF